MRRQLIGGSAWVVLGRLAALPAGLVTAMYLARLLSPAELGTYFLAMSLAWLLAMTASAGLAPAMVKLVAIGLATGRSGAARHALRVALTVTLLGGGLLAAGLAGEPGRWLAALLEDGGRLAPLLPAVAVLVLTFAITDLGAETLRGFHDLRAASLLADLLLQRALVALGLVVVWWTGRTITLAGAIDLTLVVSGIVVAVVLVLLAPRIRALASEGTPWRSREVLAHGPSFLVVRLNVWLTAGADLWILAMFRPAAEVAVYGAASRLAAVVGLGTAVFNGVLGPVIADLHGRGRRQHLERVVRVAATLCATALLALVVLLWLAGDRLLGALFTDTYATGYPILMILALGRWLQIALGAATTSLNMTDHHRDVFRVTAVASLVTIGAGVLVAPAFGGPGVATVMALSMVSSSVSLTFLVRRRLSMASWATLSSVLFRQFAHDLDLRRRR